MNLLSNRTKSQLRSPILLLAAVLALAGPGADTLAVNWRYQGTLQDQGRPANGRYDLRLTLLNADGKTVVVGPITLYDVAVRDGRFATEIELDGELERLPELRVRTEISSDGAAFVALNGLQRFDPNSTQGVCWDTQGNAGINSGTDFIGTTDPAPLHVRVNNQDIGQITATAAGPNIRLGGALNDILVGDSSVVLGGRNALITANLAVGSNATISGGFSNVAEETGTVAGGRGNHAGIGAFAAGVNNCAGGFNSMALGRQAKVRPSTSPGAVGLDDGCDGQANSGDADGDNGTFAWADDQLTEFASTGPRQFLIRSGGGLLVNTNATVSSTDDVVLKARAGGDADVDLRLVTASGKSATAYVRDSDGAWDFTAPNLAGANFFLISNGARLTAGGAWTNASSRKLKRAFAPIDGQGVLDKVLALPILTWQYRASDEGTHMGPVAEDFHAAFGLGSSDASISTVDADGVALAAIQGLNQRLQQSNTMVHRLQRENAALQERLSAIERRLEAGLH